MQSLFEKPARYVDCSFRLVALTDVAQNVRSKTLPRGYIARVTDYMQSLESRVVYLEARLRESLPDIPLGEDDQHELTNIEPITPFVPVTSVQTLEALHSPNYGTHRGHTRVLHIRMQHHHHFQVMTLGKSTISLLNFPCCVSIPQVVSPTISVLRQRSHSRGSSVQQWASKASNHHRHHVILKTQKRVILIYVQIEQYDYHHRVFRLIYHGPISIISTRSTLFYIDRHSANGNKTFAKPVSQYKSLPPLRFHYSLSLLDRNSIFVYLTFIHTDS